MFVALVLVLWGLPFSYSRRAGPQIIQSMNDYRALQLLFPNQSIPVIASQVDLLSSYRPIPSSHPTIQLLKQRYEQLNLQDTTSSSPHPPRPAESEASSSLPSSPSSMSHSDHEKIGLVIEGGGMRGCVAAGAALALSYLNLSHCFDAVYGSSAGSMIGSYFISQQCQHGYHLYCHLLSRPSLIQRFRSFRQRQNPGKSGNFINLWSILNEFLPISARSPSSAPVLNLDYLLYGIMNNNTADYALDWNRFELNERRQRLSIIATDLSALDSISLTREGRNFQNKEELLRCLRASMLVPGIAGQIMRIWAGDPETGSEVGVRDSVPEIVPSSSPLRPLPRKDIWRRPLRLLTKRRPQRQWPDQPAPLSLPPSESSSSSSGQSTHLVDAFLSEPIPYRTAIRDNCTHVGSSTPLPPPSHPPHPTPCS
jgi:hypothetical protein